MIVRTEEEESRLRPAGGPTMSEERLRDPFTATLPLSWENWLLRTMILEYSRRYRVMEGRADPTPFEPWRICDPAELKASIKAHPSKLDEKAAATKIDNYGLAGKKGSNAKAKRRRIT